MTKKIKYFLRYLVFGERIFPWFNIDPIPSFNRNLGKSQQVLFFVVLLLPSIGMQNLLHSILTNILRADLQEFLFHCCSNSSHTFESMRNSDPGVSVVSAQRHNSDINFMFTVQITGCNFQYGPNLGVSLDPAFLL